MRRAGGSRQCLAVPPGNEPREPGGTAKNTLLSSGAAAIGALGLGVGLAARGDHRGRDWKCQVCVGCGEELRLRERLYPSGSSAARTPGAAPGAAQVSPETAGLGHTGRGRTPSSFTVPFPFPCFLVPVHSAGEFREEISACVVLREEVLLGTPRLWGAAVRSPDLVAFWLLCHSCFAFGPVSFRGSNDTYFFLLQRHRSRTPVNQMS